MWELNIKYCCLLLNQYIEQLVSHYLVNLKCLTKYSYRTDYTYHFLCVLYWKFGLLLVKRPQKKRPWIGFLPQGVCALHLTWILLEACGLLTSYPTQQLAVSVHYKAPCVGYMEFSSRWFLLSAADTQGWRLICVKCDFRALMYFLDSVYIRSCLIVSSGEKTLFISKM